MSDSQKDTACHLAYIIQETMQSTLFRLLAVAMRVDLQWTYCYLKQST